MNMLSPIQRLAPNDSWNGMGYHYCDTSDTTGLEEIPHDHYKLVATATPDATLPAPPRKVHRRLSAAERARRKFRKMVRTAKLHLHTLQKAILGEATRFQDTTRHWRQRTMTALAEIIAQPSPVVELVPQAPHPPLEPTPIPKQKYREVSALAAQLLRVVRRAHHNPPQNSSSITVAKHP